MSGDGEVKGRQGGFTSLGRLAHTFITRREQTATMITRRMKIRRRLRSVRASALSEEERRRELREAEESDAHGQARDEPAGPAASPRATGRDGNPRPAEARAERAGVGEDD
jgi:hypothetical protein